VAHTQGSRADYHALVGVSQTEATLLALRLLLLGVSYSFHSYFFFPLLDFMKKKKNNGSNFFETLICRNFLTLIFIWFQPHNTTLFQIAFLSSTFFEIFTNIIVDIILFFLARSHNASAPTQHLSNFAIAGSGPLAWSILAFNQALIFHSWQHVTSVFIHISPMMLTFGLRWNADSRFTVCNDFPACTSVTSGVFQILLAPPFFLLWICSSV
jgi:hypothetical protein